MLAATSEENVNPKKEKFSFGTVENARRKQIWDSDFGGF